MLDFLRRKRVLWGPIVAVAVLLHTPLLSGQKKRPEPRLSARQQVEIVFQNGIRNAQRRNDVYTQSRLLRETLSEIRAIEIGDAGKADRKRIDRRVKQLKRMVARETPIEVL